MIVAFTGHRPQKLGGFKIPNPTYVNICQKIETELTNLKPSKVISGMALGIDQWAAFIAFKLKIPFDAAIPFLGQEKAWPKESQKIYHLLLKQAANQIIVSPGDYSAAKMQIRNEWMVKNCDTLIAIYDGSEGGTGNCIKYAQFIKKPIIFIDPALTS